LQRQNEDLTARVMQLEHALRVQQLKQEEPELTVSSSSLSSSMIRPQESRLSGMSQIQPRPLKLVEKKMKKMKPGTLSLHKNVAIDAVGGVVVAGDGGDGDNGRQMSSRSLDSKDDKGNVSNELEEWRWSGLDLEG